jgi:hypothetical protein
MKPLSRSSTAMRNEDVPPALEATPSSVERMPVVI